MEHDSSRESDSGWDVSELLCLLMAPARWWSFWQILLAEPAIFSQQPQTLFQFQYYPIVYLRLCLWSGLSPLYFATEILHIFLISLMCTTCTTYLVLHVMSALMVVEEQKMWSPSPCNRIYFLVAYSALGPDILVRILFLMSSICVLYVGWYIKFVIFL